MSGETAQDDVPHRGMITACAILATVLQLLDQTIANVALPYMQGSFSASFDEITWILTSYITASAIMTAPVGWLASRYGRKPLYVVCIIGFTATSMLCGAAQSLGQMVVFRVFQGIFGAALVPLSQATLLDIYPPERRGFAMSIWGVGVMLGPIMGPTVGGWLTETYNWRYVFYGRCHVKDRRLHRIATLFGEVTVRLPPFLCAGCGHAETGVSRPSNCRSTPVLDQLQARLSALMTYRVAAEVLVHLPPVNAGKSPETLRSHMPQVGGQPGRAAPDRPVTVATAITVSLDPTFIRSREKGERHLEVRVGNVETTAGG